MSTTARQTRRRPATEVGEPYAAGALIQIGGGQSAHIATRKGRFGKTISWGVLCGVRGVARPAAPATPICGSCRRFDEANRAYCGRGLLDPVAAAAHIAAAAPSSWVTKTDIVRYLRCPYAWWLLDRGEISFDDTVEEWQVELLTAGSAFHEQVEAEAVPIDVGPDGLAALFADRLTLFGVPLLENGELLIRGRPDGIETAAGALFPIEIKSHKDVQRSDELELAFYWLLLEPYRTQELNAPHGQVVLRRDGEPYPVEVTITQRRIREARRLIGQVRRARDRGVRMRVCGCRVCSSVRRDEVARTTRRNKDLTLLFGIGTTYAPILERAGIRSWEELLTRDSAEVVARLRRRKQYVSVAEVERWKRHAESWRTRKPVLFGDETCVREPFIALDLEYTTTTIWLIGACLVGAGEPDYLTLWADDDAEEAANLGTLAEFVADRPDVPIVTWAGLAADVSRLNGASIRFGLDQLRVALRQRHVDLYEYVRRSVRLPIAGLSLKDVGAYFAIPRLSNITDGLEAQRYYSEYRYLETDGARKTTLRERLLDYNRDDLDGLIETARRLHELSGAAR